MLRVALGCLVALGGLLARPGGAEAQIPGLPPVTTKPADASAKADTQEKPAPTKDNPEATVATTSGPIDVEKRVDDRAIQQTLEDLLPDYPGVRRVTVTVKNGTATLDGQVEDADTRAEVTEFTRRVEGVHLVRNRMKTDAQVMTGWQLARKLLHQIAQTVSQEWLVVLIALALFLIALAAARLFGTYSETLLAPFVSNVMLRSVIGSILSSALVLGGALAGLSVLHLTQAVLSILGLAGVVGLAVGFAFRDIAENFIASLLLGIRRPFRIGDYVTVAGHAGVVKSLNTRATVLITLEGNHVRIPNNVIYKEILVNSSASPSTRNTFDVLIPYEASSATALGAINAVLGDQEGLLPEPPARALVEALEPGGVRLRVYFWTPVAGVDGFKLASDVRLRIKVALQQVGIAPPPTSAVVSVAGRVPVEVAETDGRTLPDVALHPGALLTRAQAEANLRHDTRAAEGASAAPTNGHQTPMQHALNQAESHVSEEGANLLEADGSNQDSTGES